MSELIEVYYWEGDPGAEELIEALKAKGLDYRATLLDPEVPNAAPSVERDGKLYSIEEFLDRLNS